MTYGPLLNGATQVVFEGVPSYPDASRLWEVVDKYKVSHLYTAPTAIRSFMGAGDDFVTRTSRESLKLLGTVGEPINPEAWRWYFETVGNGKCPIVDTWWQTETGSHMISPMPAKGWGQKPGSATKPFFGVQPAILDTTGLPACLASLLPPPILSSPDHHDAAVFSSSSCTRYTVFRSIAYEN